MTNDLRGEIIRNAMKGAFDKEYANHQKELVAFSIKAYEKILTKEQQKAVNSLPKNFCYTKQKQSAKFVNATGVFATIVLDFGKEVPMPITSQYRSDEINIADAEMYVQALALRDVKAKIENDKDTLWSRISQVVNSTSTVTKLIEVWPESKAFVPLWALDAAAPRLPAIIVAGLFDDIMKATGKPVAVKASMMELTVAA